MSEMLDTIIVAVDQLEDLEQVISHTATLAIPLSASVVILGIIEKISGAGEQFTDPVIWNMTKSETQAELDRYANYLQEQGVETRLEIVEPATVETLLQFAESLRADLIVVAAPEEILTPLIRTILKHSTIPILLSRPGQAKSAFSNILVPLDGSQRAESSLTLATAFARAGNAQLHLVHVVQQSQTPRQIPLTSEDAELIQRLFERNVEEAKRYLEQVSARLACEVKSHVIVDGKVASSLHNLISQENIDLLILSAHGHSGEPQWPFGTIADNLINYSKVPIIVVQDLPALFVKQTVEPKRLHNGIGR